MILIPFISAELALAAGWLIVRCAVRLRNGKTDWKREALLLLMYVNLAVLLRLTFFPLSLMNGHVQPLVFDPAAVFPFRVNLVPLVHLTEYQSKRDMLVNIIGNAAMFIPCGIVLPIVYKRLDTFWKVLAAGAGLSLAIELLQLPFSTRATDIDDLLLNTLGTAAGYGILALVRGLRRAGGRA